MSTYEDLHWYYNCQAGSSKEPDDEDTQNVGFKCVLLQLTKLKERTIKLIITVLIHLQIMHTIPPLSLSLSPLLPLIILQIVQETK